MTHRMTATTRRPLVGITAFTESVLRDGPERVSCRLVGSTYVDAVERAGGVALLLPAREDVDEVLAEQVIGDLDALLLVGGGDIEARWFGQQDHPMIGRVDRARDAWEIALARAAITADLPTLGVCRGMQVLAVASGGTIEQHLPDRLGHDRHRHGATAQTPHVHEVSVTSRSELGGIVGETMRANCFHHQGVDSLGAFVASAHSADGVLEAMELPDARFCIGIQSHPETIPDDRLFAALVLAARGDTVEP